VPTTIDRERMRILGEANELAAKIVDLEAKLKTIAET
jgi:hypothetical protein